MCAASAVASLSLEGVSKRFGQTMALNSVDLTVEPGEIRGLVGPNGAGKSTLLRCVLGLVRPDSGRVRVLDRDPPPRPGAALNGVAGLVDGMRWPATMRVRSVLAMAAAYDRVPQSHVDDVIGSMGLENLRHRRVRTLSLGMRQRLGVAAALLRAPRLLVLDEPVNGLDLPGRRDLRSLLRDLAADGVAVLLSSHDLSEIAATCSTVTRIDAGAITWTRSISEIDQASLRRVLVETEDSARTATVLRSVADLTVRPDPAGETLILAGAADALDEASLALGRAGIAIRRWEPEQPLAAALLDGQDGDEATAGGVGP